MYSLFEDALITTSCQSLQKDFECDSQVDFNDYKYQSLTEAQENVLAHKIQLLPLEYMNILFFRYCFEFSISDTEQILEIQNAVGKLWYIKKMLSTLMELGENIIADQSMKKSCQLALMQYTLFDDSVNLQKPNYSNKFRNKLKDIKAAQKPINIVMLIVKRIAIIVLVCIISFSTAIVANAEFRKKFFNWTVKKFPQFSIFNSQDTENMVNDFDVLKSYAITYIPDGFKSSKTLTGKSMIVYEYSNNHNQTISITLATTISFYKDTEGATINQFVFKDNVAYW